MRQDFLHLVKPFGPTIVILVGWVFQPFEWMGAVLFFFAAMIALWGGIYFSHKKRTEQQMLREAERIRSILSRRRHDWMNHIQVLMGYQAMNKQERITAYLQKLVQKAADERMISEISYPPLAVALLTLDDRYLQWEIDVQVGKPLPDPKDHERLLRMIEEVFPWLEKQTRDHPDWTHLRLSLRREEQHALVTIEISGDDSSLIRSDISPHEWEELRNHIKKWNGECALLAGNKGIQIQLTS
ncbi:Spo0B domain-containing protein [Lihuaxuella thermophila]|uniref:Sensor_kinase_SpoOB-type, alpha-helical domain n=1 Tax=Lihuaxuella thermophila TaxID=1173111 RepID=A0A1H8FSF3_9BACL|nr:Spo0B domain-containing protein [Lihuaxuella thermophila]SEN34579.1 Sensor_kinase_SpoOB-type, alpha-helical domain [Lihuaxuella thermophila]